MQDAEVKLGDVGEIDLHLEGGKAKVSVKAAVPNAALVASMSVEMDALVLLDKLEAAIEKAYPSSAPVAKALVGLLKGAVSLA